MSKHHGSDRRNLLAALAILGLGAPIARAQPVTLVAWEGEGIDGHVVRNIATVKTNSAGGYVALLEFTDGEKGFWGKSTLADTDSLRLVTGTSLNRRRVGFDQSCGFNNSGDVVCSALLDRGECDLPRRSIGLTDSIWINSSAVLAIEDHPVALGSTTSWGVFSKVGITQSGTPWWVGSRYDSTLAGTGTHMDRGLFAKGNVLEERIVRGMHPYNMTAGHTVFSVQTADVSPTGAYGIAVVEMAPLTGATYTAVVMESGDSDNGFQVMRPAMGAGALRTGEIAGPAFSEDPQAMWKEFRNVGVLDGASSPDVYWVHGFTTSSQEHDELLALSVRTFVVAYREGDTLGGLHIHGPLEHVAVTRGYTAMVWNATDDPTHPVKETLFLDRQPVLAVGDEVPIPYTSTGSGHITNFTGINTVALSDTWPANAAPGEPRFVSVYFIANVEVQQNSDYYATSDERVQGLFRLDVPVTGVAAQCPADFDGNGMLAVQDIFAFLTAWFASDPRANFNGVNGLEVQDIFAFLSAWFAGC